MSKNLSRNLPAAIEALLFIHGEPMRIKKLAATLGAKENAVREAIEGLKTRYASEECGLALTLINEEAGLITKPQFGELLRDFVKEEFSETLSPASLETITLIAYLGPLPKSDIDEYRGVNSSFILRGLLLRGLILRAPDPRRATTFLYQPTLDLLNYLGVASQSELPDYEKFRADLDSLRRALPPPPAPETEGALRA